MNTGNPKFERDFEAFLDGGDTRMDELYRKLPQAEPDARLDSAVQAMARRAVAATIPISAARQRRWLPVLSAAAVVALAVGFAFRLGPQLWQRPASVPPIEPVATPAPPATGSTPAPTALAKPAMETPPPSPAPAAKAAPHDLQKVENAASRSAPRAFPAPARTLREPTPPPAAVEAKPAPPAPAAATAMRAQQPVEMESAAAPMQTLAAPATADRNVSLYPEHWLANIRLLLRDNQRAAALRSLDEFRKKYPDYVLPDDLRDLD